MQTDDGNQVQYANQNILTAQSWINGRNFSPLRRGARAKLTKILKNELNSALF